MRPIFLIFLLGFATSAFSEVETGDGIGRKYRIDADFNTYDSGRINVNLEMEFSNRTSAPLSELLFVLYPNRFREVLPHLNDLNYRRIYSDGFSEGEIDIKAWGEARGGPLRTESIEDPLLPRGTLIRLFLSSPIQTGATRRITCKYSLKVPEKYGSFGRYRGKLTLSGGWYPYLAAFRGTEGFRPHDAPALADWDLKARFPGQAVIAGRFFERPGDADVDLRGFREISVALAPKFSRTRVSGLRHTVEAFSDPRDGDVLNQVRELAVNWLEFVERQPPLLQWNRNLVLVQAPIREALAVEGEGMTLFSDRAFKLVDGLGQYHAVPIIRALFYQLLWPTVSSRETSEDSTWVAEALSWHWTQKVMTERQFQHVDARSLELVRALSFLPSIDQLIYAPQFAFVDVFYDMVYPFDPVRDDALKFNHMRPNGRTVFAHLEDEIGADRAADATLAYVASNASTFREVAERISGRSLQPRFDSWIAPRPAVNYSLEHHRVKEKPHSYEHEVLVRKETDRPIVEPVELRVFPADGKEQLIVWNGEGDTHTFTFETESKVKILQIDPRGRLLETRLGDNRDPPKYKLVTTALLVDYDFNANQPTGFMAAQLRKSYGGADRYNFSAGYGLDSYGFGVGYTRLFGRLIDRLRLSHGLAVGFGFSQLDQDVVGVFDPAVGGTVGVETTPSSRVTSLGASYFFGNQLSLTNPLEGGGAAASVTWGSEAFGGDHNYYLANVASSWILPFHPSHFLAIRGLLGISGPSDIPTQTQYVLGGIYGIRGLSIDDDRFKGRNVLLTSAEYRHFLLQDIDWNLWFFRVRDIQGALFTDVGNVSDTVQERANDKFLGGSSRSSFGDLWSVSDFETDFGYGIRLLVDYFGVNPGLIRFDAAKSVSQWGESVRFYFGVTQSF